MFKLGLPLMLILFSCTLLSAQSEYCASAPYRVTYQCSSQSPPCSGRITFYVAPESLFGVFATTQEISCCNDVIQNALAGYGEQCMVGELRNREAQEQLAELSTSTNLLIADCSSHTRIV